MPKFVETFWISSEFCDESAIELIDDLFFHNKYTQLASTDILISTNFWFTKDNSTNHRRTYSLIFADYVSTIQNPLTNFFGVDGFPC